MFANVEMTDTFGGEANYCWVRRASFLCDGLTDRQIILRAKAAMGVTGYRSNTAAYGDEFRLDMCGANEVIFITFDTEARED